MRWLALPATRGVGRWKIHSLVGREQKRRASKQRNDNRCEEMRRPLSRMIRTLRELFVTPNFGAVSTSSRKKQAEQGGFSHDDTKVVMLPANPEFKARTINTPVQTTQVALPILKALGLDPDQLQSVRLEGTRVLPGLRGLESEGDDE